MASFVESLNESQAASIAYSDGATLVIAGPGSGKTRTLVAKIEKTLEEADESNGVLALTFTNKAAGEMKERLEANHLDPDGRCRTATFHSFACDVLRQHGHLIGLNPDFMIVADAADREAVFQLHPELRRAEQGLPHQFGLKDVFRLVEVAGRDAVDEARFPKIAPAAVANVGRLYLQALREAQRIDISSVLTIVSALLDQHPAVQRIIRRQFPFVFVDEFQDTNTAQFELLTRIASEDGSGLFAVADDDQLIYGWNGASTDRLNDYRARFRPREFQLPENYRCHPEIVTVANQLIQENRPENDGKLPLVAAKDASGAKDVVRVGRYQTDALEVGAVCDDIQSRQSRGESGIAVLARAGRYLELVENELKRRNVDVVFVRRRSEFESPAMRWMHLLLKCVATPGDSMVVERLASAFNDFDGIRARIDLDADDPLAAWIDAVLARADLTVELRSLLTQAMPGLRNNPAELRLFVAAFHEMCETLYHAGHHEWCSARELYDDDVNAWHEMVADLERHFLPDSLTLEILLQELDLRSKAPAPKTGAVQCHTVHGAKGLEFRHVYVVGLMEGVFPDFRSVRKGDNSFELHEERRNCFVAITRAEESLTLTHSQVARNHYQEPSRFLHEMGVVAQRNKPR